VEVVNNTAGKTMKAKNLRVYTESL
jgi:hypothetical protein